jgi:mono/diheme cytochrome c family protein
MRLASWRLAVLGALWLTAAGCALDPAARKDAVNALAPAGQSTAGNPARGRDYAEAVCAACHAVAPGQIVSPDPAAPAFQSVANWPGMTALALQAWLRTSHPTMPDLIVAPDRIDDLSAYLSTLKERET